MFSVNARMPQGELDLTTLQLTDRIRGICGGGVTPRLRDDGSFTVLCEQRDAAQRIQELLATANFRMRDRKPWKVE